MTTSSQISEANWQLSVSRSSNDDAWDAFLTQVDNGHHVQSATWASVKELLGWQVLRLKVLESEQIIAGVQILVIRKKFIGKIAFASKGPIFLETNMKLSKFLLEAVKRFIKDEKIRYFAMQPPVMSAGLKNALLQVGFSQSDTNLAPSSTVILDLTQSEEDLLSKMRKKTRQYIKRGAREGLHVREAKQVDITAFYDLLSFSAKRIGFTPFAQNYYKTMWQSFKQSQIPSVDSTIFLAELVNDDQEANAKAISALLVIGFNDTVITKTIGWSGLHANCRPNEAVYWAAIKWAKNKGYRYCDLEGIDDQAAQKILKGEALSEAERHTPGFFKLGFAGQVKQLPSAYEYMANPIFKWGYKTILPKLKNSAFMQKFLERLRTQNHGGS